MICDEMSKYPSDSFCIVGQALPTASMPTAVQYGKLIVVLICNEKTGEIIDAECNLVLDVSSEFIASLFIGYSIYKDVETIVENINTRYNGVSRKAIIVALRDAYSKLLARQKMIDK